MYFNKKSPDFLEVSCKNSKTFFSDQNYPKFRFDILIIISADKILLFQTFTFIKLFSNKPKIILTTAQKYFCYCQYLFKIFIK